jgi:hypothetical protein
MLRARGREAMLGLPGSVGIGGGSSGGGGNSLLTDLEIGVAVLLALGVIFMLAEVARPVIADVEAIEEAWARGRQRR